MGYMVHHMIVVTSHSRDLITEAHAKATEIFGQLNIMNRCIGVTDIFTSPINHYCTFFVPPDGSKEGWTDSEDGDVARASFVKWLDAQRYEDGSTSLKWALVQYGDEQRDNRILRHDGEVVPGDPPERGQ
jgi:hypothetical protein